MANLMWRRIMFITVLYIGCFTGLLVLITGCRGNEIPSSAGVPSPQESTSITAPADLQVQTDTKTPLTTQEYKPSSASSTVPGGSGSPASLNPTAPISNPMTKSNIIVNHTNWDWYNAQPQQIIDMVAKQRYYFAHASVGANILDGFKALNTHNSSKYPLTQKTTDASAPTSTINGTIYEYPRGNPGWLQKIKSFETAEKNGWHDPIIDMAMYKFCYIDQKADWKAYRDSMVPLEAKYPNTRFIYWTMPLTTSEDSGEVLRAKFNQNLREWITTQHNKILMDIADIEAWSPGGEYQTFRYNGVDYEHLYSAYTSDGGHLNLIGSERMATALYSVFGLVAYSKQ